MAAESVAGQGRDAAHRLGVEHDQRAGDAVVGGEGRVVDEASGDCPASFDVGRAGGQLRGSGGRTPPGRWRRLAAQVRNGRTRRGAMPGWANHVSIRPGGRCQCQVGVVEVAEEGDDLSELGPQIRRAVCARAACFDPPAQPGEGLPAHPAEGDLPVCRSADAA